MKTFIYFLLILSSFPVFAQKEDQVWVLGGMEFDDGPFYRTCTFSFTQSAPIVQFQDFHTPFPHFNASICRPSGELGFWASGNNLFNADFLPVQNGTNFFGMSPFGFPFTQTVMLLPFPGHPDQVVYVYEKVFSSDDPNFTFPQVYRPHYALVDMNANNGQGKVLQRDLVAGLDTLFVGSITAVRHGNGRDFWVMAPHANNKEYYFYLLSPEGLHFHHKQALEMYNSGDGQVCISPDGNWFGRIGVVVKDPIGGINALELFRFDRCTGLLSDRLGRYLAPYNNDKGGVAFSPSSKYFYVATIDTVFQYDLQVPDIWASEKIAAVSDFFQGQLGGTYFYSNFNSLMLGPDNKIYGNTTPLFPAPFLHVIEFPDSAGLACGMQQHAIQLPVFNESLPNIPFYRLYEWDDSPCDTLGAVAVQDPAASSATWRVYPNPASDQVTVDKSEGVLMQTTVVMTDISGRTVQTWQVSGKTALPLRHVPDGLYLLHFYREGWREKTVRLCVVR